MVTIKIPYGYPLYAFVSEEIIVTYFVLCVIVYIGLCFSCKNSSAKLFFEMRFGDTR